MSSSNESAPRDSQQANPQAQQGQPLVFIGAEGVPIQLSNEAANRKWIVSALVLAR
jgi:hypothetical protein